MNGLRVVILGFIMSSAAAFGDAKADPVPFASWQDPCGYQGIPIKHATAVQKMTEAEAYIVPKTIINPRPDDPNFYEMTAASTFTTWGNPFGPDPFQVCPGAPFYDDPTMSVRRGRSGFLVGPNLVVTGSHTYGTFDPTAFRVVFGMTSRVDPAHPELGCQPPDFTHIPASDVDTPVASGVVNAMAHYAGQYSEPVDYAAFYLEDNVPNRRPLRMRRSGQPSAQDTFAMIGHPAALRTKLIYGVKYLGPHDFTGAGNGPFPAASDFDGYSTMEVSSGSPIYNLDRDYVEISVGTGDRDGCLAAILPNRPPLNNDPSCLKLVDVCTSPIPPELDPSGGSSPTHLINKADISYLASLLKTPELRVSPLADVVYRLPVNGTPSPATTTYTLHTAPADTEAGNTHVSAIQSSVPAGESSMLTFTPFNGDLGPDSSTTLNVAPYVPSGTACGTYDRGILVQDLTHYQKDTLHHRFEIGLTEFAVSPAEPQTLSGITAPTVPASVTYTISNPRPTPVAITASADVGWLQLSFVGVRGLTTTLAAAGQTGASIQLVATVNPASLNLMPAGQYTGHVQVTNNSACPVLTSTSRSIVLNAKRLDLEQSLGISIPMPTPSGSPVTTSINVPEHFCATNVRIESDIKHSGSFGATLTTWFPHLGLSLTSPANVTVPLWANQYIPTGWDIPTGYDTVNGLAIETLQFVDPDQLPPTGTPLSDFYEYDAYGSWTLAFADDGLLPFQRDNTFVADWRLTFTGHIGTCAH